MESLHRVRYVRQIRSRELSPLRADPQSELFDPLKAAIINQRAGRTDEAFWLIFLFVHFGKNAKGGWRYAREVYGALGQGAAWSWSNVSKNPAGFRAWFSANEATIGRKDPPGGFGNHRKFETLRTTGAAVESYVNWVGPPRTHAELVEDALHKSGGDPRRTFRFLYDSMDAVVRFGRTARFDYLSMLGKLELATIRPDSTYMANATGPAEGARLLFADNPNAPIKDHDLEELVAELERELGVGMQVMEDALCNWQKSPDVFIPFRG